MRTPDNFDGNFVGRTIYIDDQPRTIIIQTPSYIQVDSPSLPGRPCSQHGLSQFMLMRLFNGSGGYRTGGCVYTAQPLRQPTPTPPPAPKRKPALVKRIKAAIRAFKNA